MSFNKIYDVAASGMSAQRLRVQLISANVANSETTRTPEGGPFIKKDAVFQVHTMGKTVDGMPLAGVRIADIHRSNDPFVYKYDPGHPDANEEGIVVYPNVNPIEEMVNLTEAARSYDANVNVVRAVRAMGQSALDILRTQ
ncbi:MAG: flagellar basal body rod protein FlgC [Holophagales bacterium]|jgi:flagellar basal-body rod protein FlgC|nr:flagellar basal body rod protein FlgC [Holophagales bacterium]